MTLEERAQMCVDKIGILGAYQGYIIGANEQKAIDDKECESLVGLAVKEARQVFIDKACECFCLSQCMGYQATHKCFDDGRCDSYNDFRKAMTKED